MSDPNKSIPQDATNRQKVTIGGKAGQHSGFYNQIDNSTSREVSDVDNSKTSKKGMPDHSFPRDTCGVQR